MERRAVLLDRKTRIEAQLAALDARARDRDRKERTRRALLAGEAVLAAAPARPELGQMLHEILDTRLTRPQDRALFGLAPRPRDGNRPAGPARAAGQEAMPS